MQVSYIGKHRKVRDVHIIPLCQPASTAHKTLKPPARNPRGISTVEIPLIHPTPVSCIVKSAQVDFCNYTNAQLNRFCDARAEKSMLRDLPLEALLVGTIWETPKGSPSSLARLVALLLSWDLFVRS